MDCAAFEPVDRFAPRSERAGEQMCSCLVAVRLVAVVPETSPFVGNDVHRRRRRDKPSLVVDTLNRFIACLGSRSLQLISGPGLLFLEGRRTDFKQASSQFESHLKTATGTASTKRFGRRGAFAQNKHILPNTITVSYCQYNHLTIPDRQEPPRVSASTFTHDECSDSSHLSTKSCAEASEFPQQFATCNGTTYPGNPTGLKRRPHFQEENGESDFHSSESRDLSSIRDPNCVPLRCGAPFFPLLLERYGGADRKGSPPIPRQADSP
jgi:hypothetical protein